MKARLRFLKEHKSLVAYEEINPDGTPTEHKLCVFSNPVYLRKLHLPRGIAPQFIEVDYKYVDRNGVEVAS